MAARFPEAAANRNSKRELNALLSPGADLEVRKVVLSDPSLIGSVRLPGSSTSFNDPS